MKIRLSELKRIIREEVKSSKKRGLLKEQKASYDEMADAILPIERLFEKYFSEKMDEREGTISVRDIVHDYFLNLVANLFDHPEKIDEL